MGEEEVGSTGVVVVSVREFDPSKDTGRVEAVERICEVGPSGKLSLFTDLHGDPICRVRNSPTFLMLVAEIGQETVGMIRGCIKTVTCGKKLSRQAENTNSNTETNSKQVPVYIKLAYILGLRVSPCHRYRGRERGRPTDAMVPSPPNFDLSLRTGTSVICVLRIVFWFLCLWLHCAAIVLVSQP